MFTDNLSAEFHLGIPYTHELEGAGSIQGAGKLGTVESLPPTLFVQWRFLEPKALFRPYVGLGLTYACWKPAPKTAARSFIRRSASQHCCRPEHWYFNTEPEPELNGRRPRCPRAVRRRGAGG